MLKKIKPGEVAHQAEEREQQVVQMTTMQQVLQIGKLGQQLRWESVGWPEGIGVRALARLLAAGKTKKTMRDSGRSYALNVL